MVDYMTYTFCRQFITGAVIFPSIFKGSYIDPPLIPPLEAFFIWVPPAGLRLDQADARKRRKVRQRGVKVV
jgi:hypothetical protein